MGEVLSDPLIGKTIQKVRLLDRLGSGGMGTVYLAEHATLRKKVAVKVLAGHLARDPEFVSRFLGEARTASKMEHPNIVQVYDIDYVDGNYFIVMQYVDGMSLQRLVEDVGPLDPRDAASVMARVLRGLHFAHGAGIVHRDVKPANILIGSNDEPYVLDFGLAIETEGTLKLTAAGTVLGTPWYISPEQARGHRADPRSDIYSAGVTLYYALTARPPFTGQSPLAVLNKHIHDTPVPPSSLNPRVPPVMDAIVGHMLSKKADDRYLTAEMAARDLDAYRNNRPVSIARTWSPPPRVEVARPRPFIWVAAGLGLTGAIALLVFAMNSQPPDATNRPPPSPAPAAVDERAKAEVAALWLAITAIDKEFQRVRADYAALPLVREEYEKLRLRYANNKEALEGLKGSIELFEKHVNDMSRDERERVQKKATALVAAGDPYGALAAYAEFPRPLLDLCTNGRDIARDRAALDRKLAGELPGRIRTIEQLIEAEEFETARAQSMYLRNYVGAPHSERLKELEQLANASEEKAGAHLTPRLLAEIADLQRRLVEPLSRGRADEAWRSIVAFVAAKKRHEGRMVRAGSLDFEALGGVVLSDLIEGDIERRILTLGQERKGDRPADRVALLLEDALQCEWLQRRVAAGIARLEGSRVWLQGIGHCSIYPGDPPTVVPEGQASRAFPTRGLAPLNLIHLAAISEYGPEAPVAEAYASNARLCAAASVAYLYSRVRDRFHAAHRWMEKANELGASIPRHRIVEVGRELDVEAERLVRELMGGAVELAEAGKFEEARQELDAVERRYKDEQDLMVTLARLLGLQRAKFLLTEASAASRARSWARVREIVVKQLRPRYEGLYDKTAADALYHEAVVNLGTWTSAPIPASAAELSRGTYWEWFSKDRQQPAPARISEGGLRLDKNAPMFVNRERAEGLTGASVRVKLNSTQMPHSVGIIFNFMYERPLTRHLLTARSDGRLVLLAWEDGTPREVASADLPARTSLGEFHEFGFVGDEGVIVCTFDQKPVFTVPGHVQAKSTIGLSVEGDFTFRAIRLRDAKGR